MTVEEFKSSLTAAKPGTMSVYLESLWYDKKGNWEKSHQIIQDIDDNTAAWIHAYLHRKEGDTGNADYWYRRAGKKRPAATLDEEWEELINFLL